MRILGLDPGFASLGWATLSAADDVEVTGMGVFRTQKSAKKLRVRAADDNAVRCRLLAAELWRLTEDVDLVCAEAMSHVRHASVMAKVGMVWGALLGVCEVRGLACLGVTPQEIKSSLCGKKSASKDAVKVALGVRYGDLSGLLEGVPGGQHEHAYDALAAAVTCLDSDEVRLLRRVA